jgi:hypothetical protein
MKIHMHKPIQLKKTTTPSVKDSINRSPLRCGLFLVTLALACFALSPAGPQQSVKTKQTTTINKEQSAIDCRHEAGAPA